ncbi:methyltransferase domain-containing protein [bacterium]|nr:methyltransferase domain-containing protein [bacterium]
MISFEPKTIFYTPDYEQKKYDSGYFFLDYEAPNWILTDEKGAKIVNLLSGKNTTEEIVREYSKTFGLDLQKSWLHVNHFIKRGIYHKFIFEKPKNYAPYFGRKDFLQTAILKEMWVHTNNSCNLACEHCLVNSSSQEHKGLPTEKVLSVIREGLALGVKKMYFTGGEPFFRKDIFELIDTALTKAELTILSNGILFKGETLSKLATYDKTKLTLQISLDGSNAKINDAIRGKGSFENIVNGIKNLIEIGYQPTITTTVTKQNIENLDDVVRLLSELKVNRFHLLWLHRKGRAIGSGYEVENYEIIGKLKEIKTLANSLGVVIDNFEEFELRINGQKNVKNDLSVAGVSSLCVYSDGKVYPSAAFVQVEELECGNVNENSLKEILANSKVVQEFLNATVQKKAVSHSDSRKFLCGGGDVEHSFYYSKAITGKGNILGADPYNEVYDFLMDEAINKFYVENRRKLNTKAGFDAPTIFYSMGELGVTCGDEEENVHLLGEFGVNTLHSNCVLDLSYEKSHQKMQEFYGEAMETPQAELCCPASYDKSDTDHIPGEVLERFYGCGSPMSIAKVKENETVVDLGSGAGIDCFIAAKKVGKNGKVIGVDMTFQSLEQAQKHNKLVAKNLGFDVCEFREGFMEKVPVETKSVDLITSNCVINLSPDKKTVFAEMWRILKDHGRIVISDIVSEVEVPAYLQVNPVLWGECLSGALTERDFVSMLEEAGFYGLATLKKTYWKSVEGYKFFSVTVSGFKFEKKEGCVFIGQKAIYQGPFKSIMDEEGHFFPRGEAIEICTDTAQKLQNEPYKGAFLIVEGNKMPDEFVSGCCVDGACC